MPSTTRVPTSDFSVQWSPDPGPSNYTGVDEYPDLDHVEKNVTFDISQKDKFGFTAFDVPIGSTITNVKVYIYGRTSHTSGSWDNIGALLRINGTDYILYGQFFPGGDELWSEQIFTFATNPATGIAWTVDQVNGIGTYGLQHFGYVGPDEADQDGFVSRVYIEVNYTVPSGSAKSYSFIL
jgi:hypothetical protein